MPSERIGYGRVSTMDQDLNAQKDALTKAGVDRIFVEKITGTKSSRPELDKVRALLRKGDTLVITRLDRLGRSAKDLLAIAAELEEKGVQLEVIEQAINTHTAEGRLFFQMVAAFSEFEHSIMVARTKDGLAAARARGRVGGRKPKLSPAQMQTIKKLYEEQQLTVLDIAQQFNVGRQTIYRALETMNNVKVVDNS